MRRLIFVAVPVVCLAAGLLPGAQAARRDAGTGYELQNVEVLDPTMRLADARRFMKQFNDALGVQCRDCHNPKDFSSDEKPLKLVAREMMKMQQEINDRWFPHASHPEVTCWTCHRGERHPPWVAPAEPAADSEG